MLFMKMLFMMDIYWFGFFIFSFCTSIYEIKKIEITGDRSKQKHFYWPVSALKLFNSFSFKSRCFCFDLPPVISIFFISWINLVWLRLISYLLFWIISCPKYLMNILTFSVLTEEELNLDVFIFIYLLWFQFFLFHQ